MLTTFILLGIFLILAVLYILVGVFMIPKFAVTPMPEDIKTVVRSRPDYPKWKTALGYISAVVIFLGLLGVLIKQFGFNWKKQLARIIGFPVVSLIVAAIITWVS